MKTLSATLVVLCSALALAEESAGHCAVPGVKDVKVAGRGLYVGGLQDQAQLEKLKADFQVKHVVDLRPVEPKEPFDEAATAKALGLSYLRLPVKGAADLTLENAKALDQALAKANGEPVLVHCTEGHRAAALLAVRDGLLKGQSEGEALSFVRRSGLTKLEAAAKAKLAKPTSP